MSLFLFLILDFLANKIHKLKWMQETWLVFLVSWKGYFPSLLHFLLKFLLELHLLFVFEFDFLYHVQDNSILHPGFHWKLYLLLVKWINNLNIWCERSLDISRQLLFQYLLRDRANCIHYYIMQYTVCDQYGLTTKC